MINNGQSKIRRKKIPMLSFLVSQIALAVSSSHSAYGDGSKRISSQRCAFVSSPPSTSFPCLEKICSPPTRLNLFSVNLNNNKNDNGDEEDEEDFPSWVRALQQWPLTPAIPPLKRMSQLEEEKRILENIFPVEATGRSLENEFPTENNVPLASLINVEALLMASGDDEQVESGQISYTKTSDTSKLQLENVGDWTKLMASLQRSIADLTDGVSGTAGIGSAAETILKEATSRLEVFVASTSTAVSPAAVQDLIIRASQALALRDGGIETAANGFVAVAEKLAREQGLDVREAADRARQTTKYTADLVTLANGLLVAGYAKGDQGSKKINGAADKNIVAKPLFHKFESAEMLQLSDYARAVAKGAELGSLSGAIYQATVDTTHQLGHAIVQNGTTADVKWMISDSIGYLEDFDGDEIGTAARTPVLVRTLTIRGFDASDEGVDREQVLNEVCTADQVLLGDTGVIAHAGLLRLATAIYAETKDCLDLAARGHKIVINGHSIGGSLSVLILLLMLDDRGVDYVRKRVARVYTFGSPPVVMLSSTQIDKGSGDYLQSIPGPRSKIQDNKYGCDILEAVGLPSSIVYGYVQPWDPIVRLFSSVDPLYPLLGDLGEDGKTLYASGPPRTLRPVTRAIIESWDGWPRFRDNFRATVSQAYMPVGVQHILVPEPVRYLSDRLVAVNVQVPDVDGVIRISSADLLPALQELFPLDVFRISFVPSAIRSFIHHFFPAYGFPIVDYSYKTKQTSTVPERVRDQEKREYVEVMEDFKEKANEKIKESNGKEKDEVVEPKSGGGWSPAQWLQSPRNDA
jgi:pimeloyl-ACP methyl ester carboxylesterase